MTPQEFSHIAFDVAIVFIAVGLFLAYVRSNR